MDLLWLVECQHVQRRLAVGDLLNVALQQRANHDSGAILLCLLHHLLNWLAAGVIDLDLSVADRCGSSRLRLGL